MWAVASGDRRQTAPRVGVAAGILIARRVLDELHVDAVAVDPKQRRAGLGRRLVSTALSEFRSLEISRALLEVRADNTPARRLYERVGFVVEGVRPRYYGGDVDAVLMSWAAREHPDWRPNRERPQ